VNPKNFKKFSFRLIEHGGLSPDEVVVKQVKVGTYFNAKKGVEEDVTMHTMIFGADRSKSME
jgi:pimeloyl-ACP methyl ester carboxylesterase